MKRVLADIGIRRRWPLRALIIAFTAAPYLLARLMVPAGFRYLWIFPPYPEDMLAYLAWSRQSANGHLLGALKYTTVPHAPFFFNPFFLLCGWIGGLTGMDLGVVHLLMKTAGVLVFLLALERFLEVLGLDDREQTAAMLFVAFASGIGGISGFRSSDLWMPEVNTGWSLLWNPLYPWSLALTVGTMTLMRKALDSGQPAHAARAGMAAGVLAVLHPYHLPLLLFVAAADALLRRGREAWRYVSWLIAAFIPFAIYPLWLATGVTVLQQHSVTGMMASPPLWSYLAGLGVPLVLAALSWRRSQTLTLWILAALGAAYLPVWFQRKLIFSIHIPVAILAGITAVQLVRRAPSRIVARVVAVVVALVPLLLATPVVLTVQQLKEVSRPAFDNAFAISRGRHEALLFLRERTSPESVVFAALPTMRLIPAVAGNSVPFGHWAQSVDRQEQERWVRAVFGPGALSAEERRRLFLRQRIDYVMLEGSARPGPLLAGWTPIFANREAVIFRRPLTGSVTAATIRASRRTAPFREPEIVMGREQLQGARKPP